MTIHELLQAAGLTANDEIPIWDADGTGEPTKKITAQQLAAAVVTLANLVTSVNNQTGAVSITPANIGAVAKSGDTMTGPLTLNNTDRGSRAIHFSANGTETGWISTDDQTNIMQFLQINPNVAGAFALYQFPAANENPYGFYEILTTKSPVLVPQGGTGATTPDGARANLGALGSFTTGVSFGGSATNFYQNLGAQISTMADYEARLFVVYADATSEPFYQGHTYSGKIIRYNSTTCSGILTDETGQAVIIGCSSGTWSVRSL